MTDLQAEVAKIEAKIAQSLVEIAELEKRLEESRQREQVALATFLAAAYAASRNSH